MDTVFRRKIEGLLKRASRLERKSRDRIEASRCRLDAALNLEKPDRVPVTLGLSPIWSDWYLKRRYHVKIGRYWRDPKLLVEYQLRTCIDSFGDFDDDRTSVVPGSVGPLGGVVLHPSIVGCKTVFPEDDFAWIDLRHRALDSRGKIDRFTTPEICRAGLMPETLEMVKAIENLVGDLIPVRIQGGDGSPLQMATYIRGISQLIRDMHSDPALVRTLMGKMMSVYEEIDRFYEAQFGIRYAGEDIEGILYDNPLAYFSPALVERFVLPHYRRYARKCRWRNWSFETQDNMDQFLGLLAKIPVRTIHNLVSSSDLAAFKDRLGGRGVRFKVFLSPGASMLHPARLRAEVGRIVNTMGLEGGWTLSSGVLSHAVPPADVRAFVEAARACCFSPR